MGSRISLRGRGADIFFGAPPEMPVTEATPKPPVQEQEPSPAWLEPPKPAAAPSDVQLGQPTPAAQKQASFEAPKQAPLQASKLASKQVPAAKADARTLEERLAAVFSSEGLKANTFRYTQEELDAIRDIVYRLETIYGKKIDKNDVVRLALNWLIYDFDEREEESLLVRILTSK